MTRRPFRRRAAPTTAAAIVAVTLLAGCSSGQNGALELAVPRWGNKELRVR